jgi:uncharacterized membrane protein
VTLTIALVIAIMVVFTGLLLLLPNMAKPTVPFGVRVPQSRAGDPAVQGATRQYYAGVVLTMAVVTAALVALALVLPQIAVLLAASLVPLAAWLIPYLSARRTVMAAKRDGGWFDNVPQAVVTDTTWRTSPPPYPWLWAVPAIAILLATIIIGIIVYPSLPGRIAIHIGVDGPDRFADTTVRSAFGLVALEVALTAALLGVALLALRARPELSAAAPRESAEQYRQYAVTMAKLVLLLAAGMNLTFLIASLMMWDVVPASAGWAIASAAPALIAATALVVGAVRAGQSGHRIKTGAAEAQGTPAASDRDDDAYWIGGLIYNNPDDPAAWVPKRFGGIGWTINFARPMAWVFTGAFLAVMIGVIVWAIMAES